MSETVTDVPTRTANEIASAYEEAVNNMASADISVTEVPSCDTASKIPNGTAPQGEDTAPAPGSTAPKEENTAPASAPAPGNTAPGEESTAPAPGNTAPGEEGTAPASGGDTLRLRMKVWTDPQTHRRYLMPSAFMRDIVRGQPVSDVMYAYAMRDDDTKVVTLTALEWNSLPFFYFREDGWAPRAGERPIDVIR